MRIFANRRIKWLLGSIGICGLLFIFWIALLAQWKVSHGLLWAGAGAVGLCAAVCALCFWYFRDQQRLMENAVGQIRAYVSGDRDAMIECDEEGELYRLFHEVNSLAAILNAHARKEEQSRIFLKNTISDISHQLKTPLAALNIYNGIIQGTEEFSDVQEFSRLSEQELDRIENLVQNLLKITKLDAGTVCMEKNPEKVSEMMDDVRKQFQYRADQEKKTLVFSGDEEADFACDRLWMTEALGNLVKNALDHTEQGDTVFVQWKVFASMLRITVKDNGSGIAPEDLHHIFKRFYRSRFSQDTKGIGLGLPLAKAVVEAHGGTIEAASTLGVGTTFTMNFLIPVNKEG